MIYSNDSFSVNIMATSKVEQEILEKCNKTAIDIFQSGELLTRSPYANLFLDKSKHIAQTSPIHKGDAGLVGVVGGSKDYTGGPYFAGISALRAGADLAHIFCVPEAAPVIKSYNPDLIVHPLISGPTCEIEKWLARLTVLVIGPGLGRDDATLEQAREIVKQVQEKNKGIVLDADGLFLATKYPECIYGYRNSILTPNHREFYHLYKAACKQEISNIDLMEGEELEDIVKKAAAGLGNVTVLCKGAVDVISDGITTSRLELPGSFKRCGGQGDILAGVIGTFLGWYMKGGDSTLTAEARSGCSSTVLAGTGGSLLTRMISRQASEDLGVSLTTSGMVDVMCNVVNKYFMLLRRLAKP